MVSTAAVSENDRVVLRDRPWIVRRVVEAEGSQRFLKLEALDDDEPRALEVVVPPEEPLVLPPEMPSFNLAQLDSLTSWANAHQVFAATLVQHAGMVSGARFGRVILEAYQLAPALQLLAKPRPCLLIADDVGLGKTIEAGLAMLELMVRGRVSRVLVVAPPGLMEQWRQELSEKFGLEFRIIGNASDFAAAQETLPAGVSPWDALPRVITSIDYVKKETVRTRALRKRWDMVIVDEAHALAESGTPQNPYRTQRTRLGMDLRKASRSLILLTATPHNGYAHAFRSLLELVEPTLATFRGSTEDLRRRVQTAMVRRMKYQICRQADGRTEPVFRPRTVQGLPVKLEGADRELLQRVSAYCSLTAKNAQGTDEGEIIGFAMQIVKKRALSSRKALFVTIEHRLAALEQEEAREEPPSQQELRDLQADLPLTESQTERTARWILRSAIPKDEQRRRSEVRALTHIRTALRKLPDRDPKIEALILELKRIFAEDPSEKVIIFTEYRDTLDAVRTRIDADPELQRCYAVLHGGLSRRERLRRQEHFAKPETRVLLATDAASEGLNLQRHCRRIIHMELPWNPNRLEQRNGRVDRYGQTREPLIRYLYYPDSPEDDVLARLVEKIQQMIGDYVSAPDILGAAQGMEAIQKGLALLNASAQDVDKQKQSLVRAFEERAKQIEQELQPLLLVGQQGEAVSAALNTAESLLTDDTALEQVVLAVLGPGAVRPVEDIEGAYRIEVPWAYRGDDTKPVYEAVTFRRSVAARHPADKMEFITPAHPLVKALAADARRRLLQVYPSARGLPPRRLAARAVPPEEPASALFTWFGRIESGAGLLEERLIPVRVGLAGQILGNPEQNRRWLTPEPSADVPKKKLEDLFSRRFDQMLQRSRDEAHALLRQRAEELRRQRRKQAEILRQDLDRDCKCRLQEIEYEERQARGLAADGGVLLLFNPDVPDGEGSGFEARRQVVESHRTQRLEEIDLFEQVTSLPRPQPLGVLFLVPEGGAS